MFYVCRAISIALLLLAMTYVKSAFVLRTVAEDSKSREAIAKSNARFCWGLLFGLSAGIPEIILRLS